MDVIEINNDSSYLIFKKYKMNGTNNSSSFTESDEIV